MQTFQRLLVKQFANDGLSDPSVQLQTISIPLPTSAYRRRVYIGFAWDTQDATAVSAFCQALLVLKDGNETELARFGWSYSGARLTQPNLDITSDMCVPSFSVEFLPADLGDNFPTTTPGTPEEMIALALNNGTETRTLFRMQPMTVLNNTSELTLVAEFTQGVMDSGLFQIAFGVRADAP